MLECARNNVGVSTTDSNILYIWVLGVFGICVSSPTPKLCGILDPNLEGEIG